MLELQGKRIIYRDVPMRYAMIKEISLFDYLKESPSLKEQQLKPGLER